MRHALGLVLLVGCGNGPFIPPAGIDDLSMDLQVDPCTDFYQYACGGFISENPLGSMGALIDRRAEAFFATERAVTQLLTETMGSTAGTPEAQLVRAYNTACRDGSSDRRELQRLLQLIDGVSSGSGLAPVVAELHAVGVGALFGFGSALDLMRPRQTIAGVWAQGLGLPDRAYYLLDEHADIRAAYRDHVQRLGAAVGVNDPALADAVLAIETRLAEGTPDEQASFGAVTTYNPTGLMPFVTAHAAFDWTGYFAATSAPAFTSLNVAHPGFFAVLELVLSQEVDLEAVKRYLRWRAIEAVAPQLDDGIVAEEARFHLGSFYGFTTPLPRTVMCERATTGRLDWEMSTLYVARHAVGLKDKVTPMVDTVRDRFYDELGRLDWLDAPTLSAVRTKLDAVRAGVSAPADFGPYVLGSITLPADFASAEAARARRVRERNLASIGTAWTRDWFMSPITVNAAYTPLLNAINLPAATLQAPLYRTGYAEAVNWGALGSLIGHELTHGFDDTGRQFDEGGALRTMWSEPVQLAFFERAECLVEQYSAIEAAPGKYVSGRLTVGENIADLGGLKLAYLALAPKDLKLESATPTDSQAFFLAYAQAWCANLRPQYLELLLETDPHAPPRQRVNAVLQNLPQFAAAYGCKEGQPMAPKTRCAVW